jgi:hypothetical protein
LNLHKTLLSAFLVVIVFCVALKSFLRGIEIIQPADAVMPSDEAIAAEKNRIAEERNWKALRQQRNRLIAETDYLALSDSTLSAEMATYRQALRDLPANTTDPANPVWPTKYEYN